MNGDPFHQLRNTPAPRPSEAAKERALYRATLAFRSRPQDVAAKPEALWWGVLQAVGLSVAVFLAMLWLLPLDRQGELAVQKRLLQEMSAIFPESLNAVIESRGGTQLDLTAAGSETRDQPLLIEFRKRDHSVRVLSYSGRDVTLTIDGERVNVEGLLTADGRVIVAGSDFVCAPGKQAEWEGYEIRARAL